ncbi:hypothetical protein RRG08_013879 [Elysia crispata]|uniref:Uncharacterized protein n=1 Tax=Elysia crispata TaxID=231223 RepID=A0AAE0YKX4_9GAST|nr:hypothetical protein RRG08_013879 [Elysia crispata]
MRGASRRRADIVYDRMERGHGDCARDDDVYHHRDHEPLREHAGDQDDVMFYLDEAPPLLLYSCYIIMSIYMAFIAYLTALLISCALDECS